MDKDNLKFQKRFYLIAFIILLFVSLVSDIDYAFRLSFFIVAFYCLFKFCFTKAKLDKIYETEADEKVRLQKGSAEKTEIKYKECEESQNTIPKIVEISEPTKRGFVTAYKILIDDDAMELLKRRYIAFDVETTGLNPNIDRIVEIGAVLFENGEITKRYGTLVNPCIEISSKASAINHITNEMLNDAPNEIEVYANLVEFLGDSLNEQTAICAHNAQFDMGFLNKTLTRLGYNAKIYYVDTLSLSRELVKGLKNYKQDTVATHFGLINEQAHRAVTDAETCGKILWELLKLKTNVIQKRRENLEKRKPNSEEMEVCAYIQNIIVKNNGDTEWLGFYKNSGNYIDVNYLYTICKFKFSRIGKYIIVDKDVGENLNLVTSPCTKSEGGENNLRVFFDSPFDLEPLSTYIIKKYRQERKSALDYLRHYNHERQKIKNSMGMMYTLDILEMESLLMSAYKKIKNEDEITKDRDDIEENFNGYEENHDEISI